MLRYNLDQGFWHTHTRLQTKAWGGVRANTGEGWGTVPPPPGRTGKPGPEAEANTDLDGADHAHICAWELHGATGTVSREAHGCLLPGSPTGTRTAELLAALGLASQTRARPWGSALVPVNKSARSSFPPGSSQGRNGSGRPWRVPPLSVPAQWTPYARGPARSPQFFSSEPSLQSFFPSHSGLVLLKQSPLWQR